MSDLVQDCGGLPATGKAGVQNLRHMETNYIILWGAVLHQQCRENAMLVVTHDDAITIVMKHLHNNDPAGSILDGTIH